MKFLLLLIVVAFAVWLLKTKARGPAASAKKPPPAAQPAEMLACAHCGVHLPQPEVQFDAAGRAFCSEAHRLAGPR